MRATRSSRVPGARLRVAGDADAFLSEAEIDHALGESTVAVFPYRPELDQSGALLRALGAGVPAVVYDVGGLAEPVRAFGAGRVVAAGRRRRPRRRDQRAARRPRRRWRKPARVPFGRADELTWDARPHAHLELYQELV